MPYIPPMVNIAYPEVPADLVAKLNDLITALNTTSTHLSQSGSRVQTFMGQADGAVQNVASISQGKTTQALVDTWYYTTIDGNHSQTGMTGVSGHLNTAIRELEQHVQAVKDGMSAVQALQASGGRVLSVQAGEVQQQINNLTNALSNIGLALDAAARLINSINNGMPSACATGFLPGGYYPTFSEKSFDNTYNMTGRPSGGPPVRNIQELKAALAAEGWSQAKIDALMEQLANDGMSQADIDQFIQALQNTTLSDGQILNFFKGHPGDIPTIWKDYQTAQNIPNISTVLQDMATGSPTNYKGSLYQLSWAADWVRAHPNGPAITLVEDMAPDGKAADAILDNGTVIDLKNYNWPDLTAKNLPFRNVNTVASDFTKQIARDRDLYPGQPIVYYFNGNYGVVPEQIQQLLTSEGVGIAYWPPLS